MGWWIKLIPTVGIFMLASAFVLLGAATPLYG
jgi:hypothetical protein